jgi:hypothetical protein
MLNILPADLKKENKLRKIFLNFRLNALIIFVILLFPVLLLFSNYLLFENILKNSVSGNNYSPKNNPSTVQIKNDMESFNSLLIQASAIQNEHYNPTLLIEHFTSLVPDGVTISNVNFQLSEKKISFSGNAKTRDELINFQNNLSDDDVFTNFTYPVSNLSEKENIDFNYSGTLAITITSD